MNPQQVFEIWAPADSVWSRWAKPVVFAESPSDSSAPAADEPLPRLEVVFDPHAAIIVDLPGAASVDAGLGLAGAGYRPVPLYNGNSGPAPLVDVEPIRQSLFRRAPQLARLSIATQAPPAFLLDAKRLSGEAGRGPGRFDNRWLVFPQDFPSASFLKSHGIERVLLIQEPGEQPLEDLAHVLLRWQEARLGLLVRDPAVAASPRPLQVSRPSSYRSLWYRAQALLGFRRNSAGGFGSFIPELSLGGGGGAGPRTGSGLHGFHFG